MQLFSRLRLNVDLRCNFSRLFPTPFDEQSNSTLSSLSLSAFFSILLFLFSTNNFLPPLAYTDGDKNFTMESGVKSVIAGNCRFVYTEKRKTFVSRDILDPIGMLGNDSCIAKPTFEGYFRSF